VQAGLADAIADAVAKGQRPEGMKEDEALVYDFCTTLHRRHFVDDALFERATSVLGDQGVVDLIGVSGYYTLVSMVLNVAEIPLPAGTPPPW
jgi:4-carboxymuconolactone decarboxylase